MRFITAKFASQCKETGSKIKKGDAILYNPNTKEVFCSKSKTYQDEHENRSTADYIQAQEDAYFDNFCQRNNI